MPKAAEGSQSNMRFVKASAQLSSGFHLFGAASEAALHCFRAVLSRMLHLPRSVLNLPQPRLQSVLQRRLGVRQLHKHTQAM